MHDDHIIYSVLVNNGVSEYRGAQIKHTHCSSFKTAAQVHCKENSQKNISGSLEKKTFLGFYFFLFLFVFWITSYTLPATAWHSPVVFLLSIALLDFLLSCLLFYHSADRDDDATNDTGFLLHTQTTTKTSTCQCVQLILRLIHEIRQEWCPDKNVVPNSW